MRDTRRTRPRAIADLLGEPLDPTPIDTIQGAIDALGGDPGGDTANGVAFYRRHESSLCFVPEMKQWQRFANGVWGPVDPEVLFQAFAAERLEQALQRFRVAKMGGDANAEAEAERAMAKAGALFNDRRAQERALKQARPHMSVSSARFNRTPQLLGLQDGVLNLKTMQYVKAPASEYISKRMGCVYDADAQAPMWNRFIREVLPDDDVRGIYQRAVGAALFGVILDNGFVFMLGELGDNGKSVACNVLTRLFGDYCMIASADLLLQTKHDTEHKRLVAGLSMGPRLVLINELPKHAVWDDARVKLIGSRDDIQARKLYGEAYSFTPTHHVFVRGNHAPGSQDASDSFWKRVWPVPFDVQIPKARQIAGLDDKIAAAELPGVLNWALEGARAWRADGEARGSLGRLVLPKSVIDARERYRAKTDYVARWLLDRTEEIDGERESQGALWASYRDFCYASGLRSAGIDRELFDELEKRGYRRGASNGARVFRGLRLLKGRFNDA